MWARFGQAERCTEMIRGLLTYNMLPNMFANHPPFQLDGNYGIVAGISEMLVQSHLGEIVLLPALPKSWPEGHANGLKARGAIEVKELSWKSGTFERAVLLSAIDQTVAVRIKGDVRQVSLKANQPVELR
jgi:alpha-L-fucosidase 2